MRQTKLLKEPMLHLRFLGKPPLALSTDQRARPRGQAVTQALSGPRTAQEGLESLQFTTSQSPMTDHPPRWFWLVFSRLVWLTHLRFVQEPGNELRESLGFLLLQ